MGEVKLLLPMAFGVRTSPDGKRFAVSVRAQQGDETPKEEIHVIDATTYETLRIVEGGILPSWFGSERLVYNVGAGNQSWQGKAWLVELATKESRELRIPQSDLVSDVSSDGKWILTASNRNPSLGRHFQVYLMHLDGSEQRGLSQQEGLSAFPRFSPDAKHIVYAHWGQDLVDSLCVVDIDGQNRRELLKSDHGRGSLDSACWSPDGKWLAVK